MELLLRITGPSATQRASIRRSAPVGPRFCGRRNHGRAIRGAAGGALAKVGRDDGQRSWLWRGQRIQPQPKRAIRLAVLFVCRREVALQAVLLKHERRRAIRPPAGSRLVPHEGGTSGPELDCEHDALEDIGRRIATAGTRPHFEHAPIRVDAQMRKSDDHALGADEESLYWHDGRKHVVWWHPGRAAEIRLTVFHDLNDIGVSKGMAAVPGRGILTGCPGCPAVTSGARRLSKFKSWRVRGQHIKPPPLCSSDLASTTEQPERTAS